MSVYFKEFPFEEIRDPAGDYFDSVESALLTTKCKHNQIWLVTIGDSNNPYINSVFTYGPIGYHDLNYKAGFIVTNEKHDGNTFYVEQIMQDEFE